MLYIIKCRFFVVHCKFRIGVAFFGKFLKSLELMRFEIMLNLTDYSVVWHTAANLGIFMKVKCLSLEFVRNL